MFKAESAGKVLGVGYQPGKSATLVRNPNWNASTDFRPAYVDQINIQIGGDTNVIGRQVLEGSGMVQNDTPAQPIVRLAYEKYRSQLQISPGAGDHYVAINNSHGPFTNVNLRKAYWAALDREAMDKVRGGELVTNVMTHFIYPEIPGFEQAGGLAGPKVDYNEHPQGNMAVAEKYMKLAGYPSGKYTGSATVQVVGSTGDPAPKTRRSPTRRCRTWASKRSSTWSTSRSCTRSTAAWSRNRSTSARTSAGSPTSAIRRRCSTCRSTAS